jgi:hypothetical protein
MVSLDSHTLRIGRLVASLLLVGTLLSACAGSAIVDVNLDEEGSGTITITGTGLTTDEQTADESDQVAVDFSQPLLLLLILGGFLLLLVLIIVLSRPRSRTVVHEQVTRQRRQQSAPLEDDRQ